CCILACGTHNHNMNFEPCNWAKTSTQLAEGFPSTPWRYLNSTTPEGEKPLKIRENPRSRSARKRNIARKFWGVQVEGKFSFFFGQPLSVALPELGQFGLDHGHAIPLIGVARIVI